MHCIGALMYNGKGDSHAARLGHGKDITFHDYSLHSMENDIITGLFVMSVIIRSMQFT